MSQYVMHRDGRYYKDPLTFNPERWTTVERESRPQFSYFPFGGGPRRCIGEGFAWMEGILLIATLAQLWQMRLVPHHPIALNPVIDRKTTPLNSTPTSISYATFSLQ